MLPTALLATCSSSSSSGCAHACQLHAAAVRSTQAWPPHLDARDGNGNAPDHDERDEQRERHHGRQAVGNVRPVLPAQACTAVAAQVSGMHRCLADSTDACTHCPAPTRGVLSDWQLRSDGGAPVAGLRQQPRHVVRIDGAASERRVDDSDCEPHHQACKVAQDQHPGLRASAQMAV